MKYKNLDYSEMIALLNYLMQPLYDGSYEFLVETTENTNLVCITAHRINKFPDIFPKRD